jgi:DNA-directed RNA polymerase specialized sigma24 family protein
MINRTQAAIASLPERPTSPRPKPWWQDHPEIEALKTRVMDEINNLPDRPPVEYRDPIGDDAFNRVSVRELRDARDDLARAKARYDDAVRAARTLGLSWGQIGGIVGVSRQQLHRRYRDAAG